ncbi:MAG: F0F1 ATP synthase subunit epsilon [Phaeodactylibacter sp.]|nr:F0F1 ATP synthase subunit epsilon [Phaeodactylibacter sp.]MCB9263868.1 F0F1 ATP synthase subunit epsilon [Lewinellaceae bacterium]MCB9288206.1 F0F1 ATP synthase subunit epsilon [Lewinellaceae bacterium]
MNISVLTPEKEIFQGNINSVKVPGSQGAFQVLNNHAPIVSSLEEGKVSIVTAGGGYRYFDIESGAIKESNEAGKTLVFDIKSGFIEVLNNEISLLVTGVENGLNG